MSTAGLEALTNLDTLLTANWNAANTDSITPKITNNVESPWDDIDWTALDLIYVKYDTEVVRTGLYALEFFHDVAVTIEVITTRLSNAATGRGAHFKKMMDETARIIKANARQAGYAMTVVRRTRTRYVKDRSAYIGAIEVDLIKVKTS